MPTFTNRAALTYQRGTALSNVVTGEIRDVLTVTKTPLSASYTNGEPITYVVNLLNTGNTALTGLTLTDDLGTYTTTDTPPLTLTPLTYETDSVRYFSGGVLQPTPTVGTTPLTFSGINVPANGNATVIYRVAPNEFAPLTAGSSVVNTVTATGAGLTQPVTAAATLPAAVTPDLRITKAAAPLSLAENEPITYTFTIFNYGPAEADAAENVVLSDTFDPRLTGETVTYNGTPWTRGTEYNYDEGTGVFTTVGGNITVPAATYTRDPATGAYTTVPGTATLTVTGTV